MSERREQVVSIIYRCKDGLRHTVYVPGRVGPGLQRRRGGTVIDTYECKPIAIRRVKIEEV